MMEHRIEGTRVVLKGGHVVTFDLPVWAVLPVGDLLIVTLAPSGADEQNVYALGPDGAHRWRIHRHPPSWFPGPYLSVSPGPAGVLHAIHSSGVTYDVEAETGRVLGKMLTK